MSKYNKLWIWISKNKNDDFTLSFDEVERIAEIPIDHSFLTYKKELIPYGFSVGKISMKNQIVSFKKEQ